MPRYGATALVALVFSWIITSCLAIFFDLSFACSFSSHLLVVGLLVVGLLVVGLLVVGSLVVGLLVVGLLVVGLLVVGLLVVGLLVVGVWQFVLV